MCYDNGMYPLHSHAPLPEDISILNESLTLLTPRQREAVELWSYGCTQTEIAHELRVTHQTVGELLDRARARFTNLQKQPVYASDR